MRLVRRSLAAHLAVAGQRQAALLRPFLQAGLGVLGRLGRRFDARRPKRFDEAARGIQPAVQIERADDRLAGVGQERRVSPLARRLLALGQAQVALEPELAGHLGEGLAAHQIGVAHGERAFRLARKAGQQKVGHDQAEHPVAEKLQALVAVVPRAPMLRGARMGERPNQQLGPCEAMTQALGQRSRILCRPVVRAPRRAGAAIRRHRRCG